MDPETFYAIVDDQLITLAVHPELPKSFLEAIPAHLDALLDMPTMTIGGWADISDGPLALAINADGDLVSVIVANSPDTGALGETFVSIDSWLASLRLRDLGELSGNHTEFYEGLLDLSPDASITLSSTRRYMVLTAVDALDDESWQSLLPDAEFSIHYLEVLDAPGSPVIVRKRTKASSDMVAMQSATNAEQPLPPASLSPDDTAQPDDVAVADLAESTPVPPVEIPSLEEVRNEPVSASDATVIDFAPVDIPRVDLAPAVEIPADIEPLEPLDADINLTNSQEVEDEVSAAIDLTEHEERPQLESGGTYELERLPLFFDETGASLESISDELFAVDLDIVIVVKLPERRRDTPFEERNRFRWDTSLERLQMLNVHSFSTSGIRRTVHLFVESERQSGYAAYVGQLSRIAFQPQNNSDRDTAWFEIEPRLDADLYRLFKRGRLPQHRTIDITA